ncbi:MAG: hypothetical protein V3V25_13740 [Paracoccaceae bacterium]
MRLITISLTVVIGLSGPVNAQSIEKACLRSDRQTKSRKLCGCIQEAANLTLSTKDQKLAATFYTDPQKAQDLRQSNSRSHERFWDRYKDYAEVARTFCG